MLPPILLSLLRAFRPPFLLCAASSWLLSSLAIFGREAVELRIPAPEPLRVHQSNRYLAKEEGEAFLWLGCTAWGMTEWLSREDVDLYLDDRRSKGMNVVQLCLFWGKRTDDPLDFTSNPPNAYGHRAFKETNGVADPRAPAVVEGGGPLDPNDYWDHVEYCLDAIAERGMYAAVLPIWGRRYVNATHEGQSAQVFDNSNIADYGCFLGSRFGRYPNLMWILGGDVKATEGGDYTETYRALAQALKSGMAEAAGKPGDALFSYHPDATPYNNSSTWFHQDEWLDFNMIETFRNVDHLVSAIRADLALEPPKPTILAEGEYEGDAYDGYRADALRVRRQAYQSYFAGAAGFTYGGAYDEEGNGPLFGPSNYWKPLLEMEGAGDMLHLRRFLEANQWPRWRQSPDRILEGRGDGLLEKLAVETDHGLLVYFPENTVCSLDAGSARRALWHDPRSGQRASGRISGDGEYRPPSGWQDAVLILGR